MFCKKAFALVLIGMTLTLPGTRAAPTTPAVTSGGCTLMITVDGTTLTAQCAQDSTCGESCKLNTFSIRTPGTGQVYTWSACACGGDGGNATCTGSLEQWVTPNEPTVSKATCYASEPCADDGDICQGGVWLYAAWGTYPVCSCYH